MKYEFKFSRGDKVTALDYSDVPIQYPGVVTRRWIQETVTGIVIEHYDVLVKRADGEVHDCEFAVDRLAFR